MGMTLPLVSGPTRALLTSSDSLVLGAAAAALGLAALGRRVLGPVYSSSMASPGQYWSAVEVCLTRESTEFASVCEGFV